MYAILPYLVKVEIVSGSHAKYKEEVTLAITDNMIIKSLIMLLINYLGNICTQFIKGG